MGGSEPLGTTVRAGTREETPRGHPNAADSAWPETDVQSWLIVHRDGCRLEWTPLPRCEREWAPGTKMRVEERDVKGRM